MYQRWFGVLAAIAVTATAATAEAADPKPRAYPNCAALNKVYPHGVGRKGARDHTSGEPVTNFAVKKKVYRLNASRLDRDKDGIACEKL